jgi:hypothetical protein
VCTQAPSIIEIVVDYDLYGTPIEREQQCKTERVRERAVNFLSFLLINIIMCGRVLYLQGCAHPPSEREREIKREREIDR